MELNNSFEIHRPIDEAWAVLTDVERIAPCLPGAQLQEIDGDEYRGIVKIKVGPITAQYKGVATFAEKNDEDHRAVLNAKGRDTRGAGNAEAVITADLEALSDSSTRVEVNTDLKVTGKVAQFGRGVMAEVSAKIMGQFADNLKAMLDTDPEVSEEQNPEPGPRKVDMPEPDAVDLLDAAGTPLLKRLAPIVGVVVFLLILRRLLRK